MAKSDAIIGRPSLYTDKLAEQICRHIADGLALREIATIKGMPDKATILRWVEKHDGFRDRYARARELQAEHWADEIIEISDDGSNDWMERQSADGKSTTVVVDHEHVQRSKLRVDSRKWLMSKLAPKKYGDKIQAEHSGPDGGAIEFKWKPPVG